VLEKNGSEVARSKWPKLEVRWNESGDWVLGKASPIPTSYGIWGALKLPRCRGSDKWLSSSWPLLPNEKLLLSMLMDVHTLLRDRDL